MSLTSTLLSQIPGNPLNGLRQADRLWSAYRHNTVSVPTVVQQSNELLETVAWDVVICGGTLGILMGTALVQQGWKVALIERGWLKGREQEWNISRQELAVLLDLNLLTASELEATIVTEYNPARIRFHNGPELWVNDILNIGISPVLLLDRLKTQFTQSGGTLLEHTSFTQAIVHPNGIQVLTHPTPSSAAPPTAAGAGSPNHYHYTSPTPPPSHSPTPSLPAPLTTRLLLDATGHFSPLSHQARQGHPPDAVCLVVGTCAQGFPDTLPHLNTGDLFASITPIANQCQYFWEAFPAHDGRTTYLFTYVDAHPDRPSLEALFDEYFRLMPTYQGLTPEQFQQLTFQRALFGFFPCYRQSPLKPAWNRILPIGDSSGSQSPLSFGGFGAMLRHLRRLTTGIDAALKTDQLDRASLGLLQPYQPNLAVTWLFQRSMSVGMQQSLPPDQINQLLAGVFEQMQQLGDPVLKPFLQDVVQFPGLFQTLTRVSFANPALVLKIIPQLGIPALLDWLIHYGNLGLYASLYPIARSLQPWSKYLSPKQQYQFDRWLQAWQYGSGNDLHEL